jgi:hypothetical protein
MEEMRVKTQVQTDLFKTWFLEVQGARPSELTRKLATTALNIYCIHILSFSAYLPQLAGTSSVKHGLCGNDSTLLANTLGSFLSPVSILFQIPRFPVSGTVPGTRVLPVLVVFTDNQISLLFCLVTMYQILHGFVAYSNSITLYEL